MRFHAPGVSSAALPAILLLSWLPAAAQGPAQQSVAARIAAQNAVFAEQYESDLRLSPQTATAFGDYRYNDQLDDSSIAARTRAHATDEAFLARLKAIPVDGFPEQDALSHEIMTRSLTQRVTNYNYKEWEMPLNQMSGVHLELSDLPNAVPLDSVKHYEDYISRLHQAPRAFAQTEDILRLGLKDNLMPVRFLLEKIPMQCQGIIAANPFLLPIKELSPHLSRGPAAADQGDHRRREQRGPACIPAVRGLRRQGVRTARPYHPRGYLAAGRKGALPELHSRPHQHQHDAGRDSRRRIERDRPHPGRDARDRKERGLRRPGRLSGVA